MRYLLSLLVLLIASAHAKTPEDAVRDYISRIQAEGTGSVAKLMHPDELTKFQSMMGPVIEAAFADPEGREVFAIFADPAKPAKPRKLSSEDFMSLFLKWVEKMQPMVAEVLKESTFEVLGHIKEGEACHVVTRLRAKVKGVEVEKMDVISTKEHRGEARLMLSGEIKQMSELLRRSMKGERE